MPYSTEDMRAMARKTNERFRLSMTKKKLESEKRCVELMKRLQPEITLKGPNKVKDILDVLEGRKQATLPFGWYSDLTPEEKEEIVSFLTTTHWTFSEGVYKCLTPFLLHATRLFINQV